MKIVIADLIDAAAPVELNDMRAVVMAVLPMSETLVPGAKPTAWSLASGDRREVLHLAGVILAAVKQEYGPIATARIVRWALNDGLTLGSKFSLGPEGVE